MVLTEERRNELRYRMLLALAQAEGAIPYRGMDPDVDDFDLRSVASWLVENTYAVWSGGGIEISANGRSLIASLMEHDRRRSEDA